MKILLISPVVDVSQKNIKEVLMPALGLYFLQGLTPPQHQVKIVEEEMEDLNLDEDCDLVGISCMTCTAPRSYELAKEFKKRGKTVIMGGVHPTIMPDEVLQHADSIIIGEAEGVWRQLLLDFAQGNLQRKYHQPEPDLSEFISLDYKKIRRGVFNQFAITTTRGCPFNCDFCSIKNVFGQKIRHLPIENIVRYITESRSKFVTFLDDNIVADESYAKKLFIALIPLKIKWISQCSITIASNDELLQLATRSGCRGIFVGLESVSKIRLETLNKISSDLSQTEVAIKKIQRAGILVQASMVFGFDTDTKEIFLETVKFLEKNKVGALSVSFLVPYPNTKYFKEMKKDGRLLTTDWRCFDHGTVIVKPLNMSPGELVEGGKEVKRNFYSVRSILKRSLGSWNNLFIFLVVNIVMRKFSGVYGKKIRK